MGDFFSCEVVVRGSETQLQVGENLNYLTTSLLGRSACQNPGVTIGNPTKMSVMYGSEWLKV